MPATSSAIAIHSDSADSLDSFDSSDSSDNGRVRERVSIAMSFLSFVR